MIRVWGGHHRLVVEREIPAFAGMTECTNLYLNFHAGVRLFDFVAEHIVQYFVGALAGAMAGVDFLHVQIAEAFGECFHAVVWRAEQMESAEDGVNWLAGECGFDFFDDVVGAAVAATVHDEQTFGRVEY